MTEKLKQPARAAKAAVDRLFQMRQLWEDAAENYFEPNRFMLSLQNCITTSRTITFILQSHKAEMDRFEEWYENHRRRWQEDPIMRWARDARNSIEKAGDLATFSQVRAEIIASFMDGPETRWMPQELFASPRQIWRAVPKKFAIPHVLEHGTLLIERRWVDSELPDTEVLEALAHVYDEFCSTIIDYLRVNRLSISRQIDQSRPDAMGELAMDRALYLSMKDGSFRGARYYRKPIDAPTSKDKRRLVKRYGKGASWSRLKDAKTIRDVAEAYFANARVVMTRDGMHHNLTFLMRGNRPIQMVKTDHPDRASRYVLMRDLARLAHIVGADGVMMIGEAWTARASNIPPSGFAVDAPERGEAIILNAANAEGESFVMQAIVERKRLGSRKVKRVGEPEVNDSGFQFLFMPFFKEWDCVDQARLKQALNQIDESGLKTPEIPD